MVRTIYLAFVAAALAVGPATAQGAAPAMPGYPGIPADLAKAAIAFDRAQIKADGAALKDLLADDYVLINSRDQRETKAQFIADYTAPGFTTNPFTLDDQVIKVWGDGAILGGAVTATGTDGGKPYSVRLRFTDVWAKRGGKWRVVFTQSNRVAAPG